MSEAYIGLGSNLGDKAANARRGAELLATAEGIHQLDLSPLYRTAPVGKTDQDWFVNAAARVETSLDPAALLALCLRVERDLKRVRGEKWGPRTLDLDILLYGSERIEVEGLEVPHPRMKERAFVLAPLRDLNPQLQIDGVAVGELLDKVADQGIRRLYSTVAIIGASEKSHRYSNRAQRMLMERGYEVVPVSPTGGAVLGVPGLRDLQEWRGDVDTVTLYLGSDRVAAVEDAILRKRPRRVIFNPGTENEAMARRLRRAGVETLEACTLVMLSVGTF